VAKRLRAAGVDVDALEPDCRRESRASFDLLSGSRSLPDGNETYRPRRAGAQRRVAVASTTDPGRRFALIVAATGPLSVLGLFSGVVRAASLPLACAWVPPRGPGCRARGGPRAPNRRAERTRTDVIANRRNFSARKPSPAGTFADSETFGAEGPWRLGVPERLGIPDTGSPPELPGNWELRGTGSAGIPKSPDTEPGRPRLGASRGPNAMPQGARRHCDRADAAKRAWPILAAMVIAEQIAVALD